MISGERLLGGAENSHQCSHSALPASTPAPTRAPLVQMRKSASVRLGLLLTVSALLLSCEGEKPQEKRCVDDDGRYVDDALCTTGRVGAPAPDGGVSSAATGGWDQPDGGTPAARSGGYHFIWIPYGMYGGVGSYAPGYVRSGTGGASPSSATSSSSVSRGGFGATGAAHAGTSSASGTAGT
jgi:hypothetical protein